MLLLTHPRTIAGFALGTFSLVVAHSLLETYSTIAVKDRERLHEITVLDKQQAHEKAGWDHEKFIIQHSRWWKRIV